MSNTPIDPRCEAAYAELRGSTADARVRNSLERLKSGLDHLVRIGSRDFGLANVARAVEARHPGQGPAESTLRNKPHAVVFQALVHAYRRAYAPDPPRRRTEQEEVVAAIRDQALAAQVRDVYQERDELRRRNEWLKKQLGDLPAINPKHLLAPPPPDAKALPAPAALPPRVQRAVRDFIENAPDLLDVRWVEPSGELVRTSGHRIAGPGFRQALLALLGEADAAGDAPVV